MPLRKVLVANRGEIAVRVIRACREMGIESVAVYSDADRASLAVRLADEAAHIGPSPSAQSYLVAERIIDAALRHGADAIHPGYGFLSENSGFAAACSAAGLTFIGPAAETIQMMGSKTQARQLAVSAGCPVLPGTDGLQDRDEAHAAAAAMGYPVLIKAEAGGGGKGMRRVDGPADLDAALRDASSEAERSFRNGSVYIEKFLERPRHIEIQVLGDQYGHLIHLGERECSIQRRHQKVIEESPSPLLARVPDLRQRMGEAALRVARASGYYNAGTVEFLADESGAFYFLEMNTRLQVEHPVTELVTGLDLVHWQFRIASGEKLTVRQEDVTWRGSAIECRLYAEDPEQNFFPSPGKITRWIMPEGPGIRLDSGVYRNWVVPVDYDSLLAKLTVWAESRPVAISRMRRAMDETTISGVASNIGFYREILRDSAFEAGDLHTGFIEEWLSRREPADIDVDAQAIAALVAVVTAPMAPDVTARPPAASNWLRDRRSSILR